MDHNLLTSLYLKDLQRFPSDLPLSRKEELEHLARRGDAQAKRELIESALRYVTHVAAFYASAYAPFLRHDSYLDLIQEGNMALVTTFERAMKADSMSAYLRGTVKGVIRNYCLYKSGLFRLTNHPEQLTNVPPVESLDAMIGDTELTYQDVIAAIAPGEDEQETPAPTKTALYAPLHQALASLTEKQREVITRHYGFNGQEPESLYAISKRLGLPANGAWKRLQLALKKLRRYMEPSH